MEVSFTIWYCTQSYPLSKRDVIRRVSKIKSNIIEMFCLSWSLIYVLWASLDYHYNQMSWRVLSNYSSRPSLWIIFPWPSYSEGWTLENFYHWNLAKVYGHVICRRNESNSLTRSSIHSNNTAWMYCRIHSWNQMKIEKSHFAFILENIDSYHGSD